MRLGTFGVPRLIVGEDQQGFFGPVTGESLKEEEAVQLWDHLQWVGTRPYLYELKRSHKTMQDLADLSADFMPRVSAAGPRG